MLRKDYLKYMDIPVWRLRKPSIAQPIIAYYRYALLTQLGDVAGLLMADAAVDEGADGHMHERVLVEKIGRATGYRIQGGFCKQPLDFISSNHVIMCLGHQVHALVTNMMFERVDGRLFHSHSPAQLIKKPQLKRETWQVIKQMMGMISLL